MEWDVYAICTWRPFDWYVYMLGSITIIRCSFYFRRKSILLYGGENPHEKSPIWSVNPIYFGHLPYRFTIKRENDQNRPSVRYKLNVPCTRTCTFNTAMRCKKNECRRIIYMILKHNALVNINCRMTIVFLCHIYFGTISYTDLIIQIKYFFFFFFMIDDKAKYILHIVWTLFISLRLSHIRHILCRNIIQHWPWFVTDHSWSIGFLSCHRASMLMWCQNQMAKDKLLSVGTYVMREWNTNTSTHAQRDKYIFRKASERSKRHE